MKVYRNACRMLRDGPLPGPLDIDAGARSLSKTTLTMLQRKSRLSSIDKQTGATRIFVKGLSFIQHLKVLRMLFDQLNGISSKLTISGRGPR